jgi:hypothetical protein
MSFILSIVNWIVGSKLKNASIEELQEHRYSCEEYRQQLLTYIQHAGNCADVVKRHEVEAHLDVATKHLRCFKENGGAYHKNAIEESFAEIQKVFL